MLNHPTAKSLPELIQDLRSYQVELEAQNEALRYSRIAAEGASERFESLFSKVPLALMVVDELGMIAQSNAMALRLFRPYEQDPPLNFLLPLVGRDHVQRVEQSFDQARRHGSSEISEVVFLRGSLGELTGDLHIARIEYSQDEMAHFICAVIDQGPLLTERRALQESAATLQQRNEELYLSENRMAAIINSSLDAILCVDAEQNITVFNPAAAALFQCPAAAALGTPLSRFLPEAMPVIAAFDVSTQAMLGEISGQTADGQPLALEVSVSCERHPLGNITTVFARDLTARKAMEAQLQQSHKMQAIGTMAGGIAHDFNNILGAILGNVELARQDAGKKSPAQISLVEIEKAARRARDLVRQILTFSRNESPRRLLVRLSEVVRETSRLLKVTLPPTVELQVQVDAGAPAVLADATQVGQALLNLCTNAIHAIGAERGSIRIELSQARLDARHANPLGIEPGHYATLTVRDSGSGIDAATLLRIFEPFFTTKQVGQGTGLGLAVVHGVMRSHMGTVHVQSTPGVGSTFTLYFPALSGVPEAARVDPAQQAAGPGAAPSSNQLSLYFPVFSDVPEATRVDPAQQAAGPGAAPSSSQLSLFAKPAQPKPGGSAGKHVMYVDDDQALVFLVERALGRRDFKITTFTDPQQAVAVLRSNPNDFDLVVTDYNMPGYCGIDLLREARCIRPELTLALASGYITPEIEQSALTEGACALIHKPNDVSELCDTVQRLLQGETLS